MCSLAQSLVNLRIFALSASVQGAKWSDTRTILFDGFSKGKWTADLLLLLIEPLSVIIMALGERVGIDYVMDDDDINKADEDNVEGQQKALGKLHEVEKTLKETQITDISELIVNEVRKDTNALLRD